VGLAERLQKRMGKQRGTAETGQLPVLVDGISGGQEVSIAGDSFYMITRYYKGDICLPEAEPRAIECNLQLVRGIGPRTEEQLLQSGYRSLRDLEKHERWGEKARELLDAIQERNLTMLRSRGLSDEELLGCSSRQQVLFLDIESTGLYFSLPLFLVGLLSVERGRLVMKQFLARHYGEERGVVRAVAGELGSFNILMSYNGQRFDLPYLIARMRNFQLKTGFELHHVDLLSHVRRRFGGMLPNCRLVTVENAILADGRDEDIPSELIPEIYHTFVQTQKRALIEPILEHNARDLLSLARLTDHLWKAQGDRNG